MTINFEKNKAIIIVGSTHENRVDFVNGELNKLLSKSCRISADVFDSNFELGTLLSTEPDVLVIEGTIRNIETNARLKELITNDICIAHIKFRENKTVRSPKIIIICDDDPINIFPENRRFTIINLD